MASPMPEVPDYTSRPYDATTTATQLTEKYASEIKDKTVLVVGASLTSIGGEFALRIAKAQPKLIILAGRSTQKLQQAAAAISTANNAVTSTKILQIDLLSLSSVREAAAELLSWDHVPHIDVVMLNAGIMATEYALSADGFESQFATNHLGPFLFVNLIMAKVLAAPAPRVVPVSSNGHRLSPIRWADYNFSNGETYNKWRAYGQSKTANILFARSLAAKFGTSHHLQAYSLCPGLVGETQLGAHFADISVEIQDMIVLDRELGNIEANLFASNAFQPKTLDVGASTLVTAAFSPDFKDGNGGFVHDNQLEDLANTWYVKVWARDDFEAERLWKLSEKLVGQEFGY
ncbi:putative short-chain dehydrogenase [Coniella lustricola]|uniref:Putative short-chain dehydrogenase n=1 Tax=Coniella lustricola TaxID=2025994 RepID=A0A2T3A9Q5_9PEZI|nr:putative short-chain dehydrogenase [Coniella lustricola]